MVYIYYAENEKSLQYFALKISVVSTALGSFQDTDWKIQTGR